MNPNTIILFEILDHSIEAMMQKHANLNRDNFYRIAWGYLRPFGESQVHLGQSKIQLHYYKFSSQKYKTLDIHKTLLEVPDVYFDFMWPKKLIYDAYLIVELHSQNTPMTIGTNLDPLSVYEIEQGEKMDKSLFQSINKMKHDEEDLGDPVYKAKKKRLDRMRVCADDKCKLPDKAIYKFPTKGFGCNNVKFSPSGKF